MSDFPSAKRLLIFAVLLPAAVAGTNQLVYELISRRYLSSSWLYPSLVLTTAVMSWCFGRYLSPPLLCWIAFGWCFALLDLMTITAGLYNVIPSYFGYSLVSTQLSFLTLWVILGPWSWQWRLPMVLAGGAGIFLFSGSFVYAYWYGNSRTPTWTVLLIISAAVVIILCLVLRRRGFLLQNTRRQVSTNGPSSEMQTHQFGLKHLLLWATALALLLVVLRSVTLPFFGRIGWMSVFSLALLSICVAAVNLIAIWAVLGHGPMFPRLAALVAVPFLLALAMVRFINYLESLYQVRSTRGLRGAAYTFTYTDFGSNSLLQGIQGTQNTWVAWLWLNAALLAALCLFVRASGYRLERTIQ